MNFPLLAIGSAFGGLDLAAGLVMDILAGDPECLPHPVRLLGKAVDAGEKAARRLPVSPVMQGALLTFSIVSLAALVPVLLIHLAGTISTLLAFCVSALLIYYALALKCLAREAHLVAEALEHKGLEAARRQVSRIVGRDTSSLTESGVAAAAVETVAENLVDGFLSPFFYCTIGGAPLAMGYKGVNTLDSMIGYRNRNYLQFGKVAARLDDLCNYLPARMSLVSIALASPLVKGPPLFKVMKMGFNEGKMHRSPNAGLPEAAFAWVLGTRLSGPISYEGQKHERPYFNRDGRHPAAEDIRRAVKLMYMSSATGIAINLLVINVGMALLFGSI